MRLSLRPIPQVTSWLKGLGVLLLGVALAILYTWPALPEVLHNGKVIGVGEDDRTLAYYYWWIPQLLELAPLSLLNGALYTPQAGAPPGSILWIPYIERVVPLLTHPWATPEQMTFLFLAFILTLNFGVSAWAARLIGLSWPLAIAFAICMSFNPFTHWRGKMHLVLAGVYVLPLLVISIHYLRRATTWKAALLAGLPLALAMSGAHYLLMVVLTLFPVALILLLVQKPRREWKYLVLGFAPYFIAMGWIQLRTPIGVSDLMKHPPKYSGIRPAESQSGWDLLVYAARPLDYLAGNFDAQAWDPNPIRGAITRHVIEREKPNFYPQEHAVGLRWFILIAAFATIAYWRRLPPSARKHAWVALALGAWAYWCSLSPRSIAPGGVGIGPSGWIHHFFPAIRAPNRWATGAMLGACLLAFIGIQAWIDHLRSQPEPKLKRRASIIAAAAVVLSLLEFPPTLAFPTTQAPKPLEREIGCGLGVFLPYLRDNIPETVSLRGTDCRALNTQQVPFFERVFVEVLGVEALQKKKATSSSDSIDANPLAAARTLLECLDVDWADLKPELNAQSLCPALGMEVASPDHCVRTTPPNPAPDGDYESCFKPWRDSGTDPAPRDASSSR